MKNGLPKTNTKTPMPAVKDSWKQKVRFATLDNPRKSAYELGDIKCDKCENTTSMYLLLLIEGEEYKICSGCLNEGIELIQKEMIKSFKED